MVISLSQMLDFMSPCFFSFRKPKVWSWRDFGGSSLMKPTGTDLFFVRESTHVPGSFLLLWQISALTRIVSAASEKRCFLTSKFKPVWRHFVRTNSSLGRRRKHKLSVLQEASYHCNNWRALAQDCYLSGLIDISICCRLLDLGFEKDVSSILTAVKDSLLSGVRCQTVLLSATLNEGVFFSPKCLLLL